MPIKEDLQGLMMTNFKVILNNERLLDGQDFYRKNKDLSMVFLVGFIFEYFRCEYWCPLVDYNVDENLSFQPSILNLSSEIGPSIGVKINYNF